MLSSRVHNCLDTLGDPEQGSWSELLDRLQTASAHINLRGGSAKTWHVPVAEVRAKLGGVRDIAKRFEKLPRWNDHDETALEVLSSVRDLFEDACQRYRDRKRELAALDYLDLEVEATRLLREHPQIARSYRSRFRHLMVDELQDTNPAQIALLRLLSQSPDGGSPGPHRFFVGDVKQAIYRFRGGDVSNFTRLHREIEAKSEGVPSTP